MRSTPTDDRTGSWVRVALGGVLFAVTAAAGVAWAQPEEAALPAASSTWWTCYQAARVDTTLSDRDALALCRCAENDAPVRCYQRGLADVTLSQRQVIAACRPVEAMGLAYGCAPRAIGGGPGAREEVASPLACIDRARNETLLDNDQLQALCGGVRTLGPLRCYEAAHDETTLSDPEAIALCRCAGSDAPVRCYQRGRTGTALGEAQLQAQCATAVVEPSLPGCVVNYVVPVVPVR